MTAVENSHMIAARIHAPGPILARARALPTVEGILTGTTGAHHLNRGLPRAIPNIMTAAGVVMTTNKHANFSSPNNQEDLSLILIAH